MSSIIDRAYIIFRLLLSNLRELEECMDLIFEKQQIDKFVVADCCDNFEEFSNIKEQFYQIQTELPTPTPTNTVAMKKEVFHEDAKLLLTNAIDHLHHLIEFVNNALKVQTPNVVDLSFNVQTAHTDLNYLMNSFNQANQILKSQ